MKRLFAAYVALMTACCAQAIATENAPNIVFILIDDMGWKDLGCTGSTYYETPHIDMLAANGVRFETAYSPSVICAPSRGAILSGKHPGRTKFSCVFVGEAASDDRLYDSSKGLSGFNQTKEALHRHTLPKSEILFSETLRDAGYATGYFGKWHCGSHPDYTPDKRGFQVAKGHRIQHVATAVSGHWGKTLRPLSAGLEFMKNDDYVADVLTDECIDFIRENKDGAFLAVLSHYLVHYPISPKDELLARFKDKPTTDQNNPGNAALVASVDESVGRIMTLLQELDIEDNTLMVFTSDNGGVITKATSTYPLLGGKAMPFEGGARVPLIMHWPKRIKPGQVKEGRVIGVDLYPTFLAAAGVKVNPAQHLDGVNLLPVLEGKTEVPERPIVFHYPHYTKYIGPTSSILEGRWKLIRFYNDEKGGCMLFDLSKDVGEQNDLSGQFPEVVSRLSRKLDKQLAGMDAEMPTPNPDYDPTSKKLINRESMYKKANHYRAGFEARLKESQE